MAYKVSVKMEREVIFYVDAPSMVAVKNFMDANTDWGPGDTPGLIDHVTDELEVEYSVGEDTRITANFAIAADGTLTEKE